MSLIQIHRVAVIGAGPMGWQLAARTAQAGFQVVLEDVLSANLRRAEIGIREYISAYADTSLAPPSKPNRIENTADTEAVLARISFVSTVEDAVRQADLALDCLPDELESKLEIFSMLDRMAPPHTILCTPTQTQSIADIASCTYRPERCLAVQPWDPNNRNVHLKNLAIPSRSTAMPIRSIDDGKISPIGGNCGLVVDSICLIYSHWTLPSVIAAVTEFWQRLGKSVHVEYDGTFAAHGERDPLQSRH